MTRKTWPAAVAAAVAVALSGVSWSQDRYPSRMMRIVTALGPGTSTDVLARYLAEHLRRDLPTSWRNPGRTATRWDCCTLRW
jgi:tripartite-type tricarboxylate transporter receptor subunit TctC